MKFIKRPQVFLMLVAIVLLAMTLFNPKVTMDKASYRYVYVIDISQSMNVADVENNQGKVSRLNLVKQTAIESLSKLPCRTEVGFALFSGHRAFMLTEPVEICKNLHDLIKTVELIDWTATWESRSEIAKGLYKSIKLMTQIEKNTRVVFFTDGHEAPPVNPDQLPRFPGKVGEIKGVIVGVGGDKSVKIPKLERSGEQNGFWQADQVVHIDVYTQAKNKREGIKFAIGTEHLSSLREPYLKKLAEKTGLQYMRLQDAKALSSQLKHKDLSHPKSVQADIRWILALLTLLFLISVYLFYPVKYFFKPPNKTK